jgi:hypothetical protein
MTTSFAAHPNANGLVKLTGRISGYKCTRARASFVFTPSDQTKMGVIAVAAGLAGLSGQAISTAANTSDMEEEADYVEFSVDGQEVKGWVWRSPFKEGDAVVVAATRQDQRFESFGIARPEDKTVALYPHCSRGVARHRLRSTQLGSALVLSYIVFMAFSEGWMSNPQAALTKETWGSIAILAGGVSFFALMTYSLTRKWLPFAKLAEKVFAALGFPNPAHIDLVKSSKKTRTPQDPPEFGTFYFRY